MKHSRGTVWAVFTAFLLFSGCGPNPLEPLNSNADSETNSDDPNPNDVAGPPGPTGAAAERVIVKFRKGTGAYKSSAVMKAAGDRVERIIPQLEAHVVPVPEGQTAAEVIERYEGHPLVEFAELDEYREPAFVPNDPAYGRQWHLARIGAPAAWDTSFGSRNTIIAILDTGINESHPELAPNVLPGWNVVQENTDTHEDYGHGTWVAGTAAATGNNAYAVASVAWGCPVLPIRVTDNGWTTGSLLAEGIVWAADHGARVANVSFAMISSSTVSSAASYFNDRGGVVVFGAGNSGVVRSLADDPNIITVSGTDDTDLIASFSDTGDFVDLSAPGKSIVTVGSTSATSSATGTSFSAPIVSGVGALILSTNPELTASQVERILEESADDLGPRGWDPQYGWGRVNAARAVQMALDFNPPGDMTAPFVRIREPLPQDLVRGSIDVLAEASDDTAVARVDLYCDDAFVSSDTVAPHSWPVDTTTLPDGPHEFRAVAFDSAGNSAPSDPVVVTVDNVECAAATDCDDGSACTADDCVGGQCTYAPLGCDDSDACTTDRCDPASGCAYVAVSCDDGDASTADSCDASLGCVNTPLDCDDGNACTHDAFDANGQCVHAPVDCSDGNACTSEICSPTFGCLAVPITCDDGDPCTVDSCNSRTGCSASPVVCPSGQACVAGVCQSQACDNDGTCEEGEDCSNCPGDCPAGNGSVCGNGLCEAGNGEDCLSCPSDCAGKQDGNPAKRFCCGAGGGENPVACGDSRCNSSGFACISSPTSASCCGDGVCEGTESGCNCAIDCGEADGVELSGSTCRDGLDNDCDGAADCNDPDCEGTTLCPKCLPTGTPCSSDSDCCSQKCRGGGRNGPTCGG